MSNIRAQFRYVKICLNVTTNHFSSTRGASIVDRTLAMPLHLACVSFPRVRLWVSDQIPNTNISILAEHWGTHEQQAGHRYEPTLVTDIRHRFEYMKSMLERIRSNVHFTAAELHIVFAGVQEARFTI